MGKHRGTVVKDRAHVTGADRGGDDDAEQTRRQRAADQAVPRFSVAKHAVSVAHHTATVDGPRAIARFWKPFSPHHGEGVGKKTGQIQPQR